MPERVKSSTIFIKSNIVKSFEWIPEELDLIITRKQRLFLPSNATGMVAAWMGVGCTNFISEIAFNNGLDKFIW